MIKHNLMLTAVLVAVLLSAYQLHAQSAESQQNQTAPPTSDQYYPAVPSDQEIELMRKDVRSQKKQIIAANMSLTEAEAEKFWPIYDQYTAALTKINDTKIALVKEYLASYSTITDQQAESYVKRWAGVDESVTQLRIKYFPVFHQVLSGKSTALFFQMDHRLGLLIDLQLTAQMPVIEP
jgi:Spy/CpxP family protein refolding chaperone